MSLLETRITRIIEMKLKGQSKTEIAESLNLSEDELKDVEDKARLSIVDAVANHVKGLEEISANTKLPPLVVSLLASHYNIDIYNTSLLRPSMQQRIDAIRLASENGAVSTEVIADLTNLSKITIKAYSKTAGIPLPGKHTKRYPKEQRIEAMTVYTYGSSAGIELPRKYTSQQNMESIKQAIEQGAQTIPEIIRVSGLSPWLAKYHLKSLGLYYNFLWTDRAKRAESVNKSISGGEKSLEALCKAAHLKANGFAKLCKEYHINLPSDLIPFRFRPKMDALIDKGATLEEIGAAEYVSKEKAR